MMCIASLLKSSFKVGNQVLGWIASKPSVGCLSCSCHSSHTGTLSTGGSGSDFLHLSGFVDSGWPKIYVTWVLVWFSFKPKTVFLCLVHS